jgi:DNA-binding response OmpR family regulator
MEAGSSAADAHRLLAEQLGLPAEAAPAERRDVVMLILLAERDRFAAELCEYFLRTEGYEVRLASNPEDAERSFAHHRPDLAVVDLTMPEGLALCGRLARDDTAPVLAVSVLALQEEAVAAGASAFLQKPLDQLQFVSTVRDLLGTSALTRPDGARVP